MGTRCSTETSMCNGLSMESLLPATGDLVNVVLAKQEGMYCVFMEKPFSLVVNSQYKDPC